MIHRRHHAPTLRGVRSEWLGQFWRVWGGKFWRAPKRHINELSRVTARWTRYELLVIDEMGYVPLAEAGAEMLFQVIAGRAEKAAVIVTTNLPFSEWTTVFPNARLCKAMLDRLTDQAHIIETGSDSYRFRRTLDRRRKKSKEGDQEK